MFEPFKAGPGQAGGLLGPGRRPCLGMGGSIQNRSVSRERSFRAGVGDVAERHQIDATEEAGRIPPLGRFQLHQVPESIHR